MYFSVAMFITDAFILFHYFFLENGNGLNYVDADGDGGGDDGDDGGDYEDDGGGDDVDYTDDDVDNIDDGSGDDGDDGGGGDGDTNGGGNGFHAVCYFFYCKC